LKPLLRRSPPAATWRSVRAAFALGLFGFGRPLRRLLGMTVHEQCDRVGPGWNVAVNRAAFADRLIGCRFRTNRPLPGTSRSLLGPSGSLRGSGRSLATPAGTFLFLLGLFFREARFFEVGLRRLDGGLFGAFRSLAASATTATPTTARATLVVRRFVFLFVADCRPGRGLRWTLRSPLASRSRFVLSLAAFLPPRCGAGRLATTHRLFEQTGTKAVVGFVACGRL
jgi:hypothetical protein